MVPEMLPNARIFCVTARKNIPEVPKDLMWMDSVTVSKLSCIPTLRCILVNMYMYSAWSFPADVMVAKLTLPVYMCN